MKDIEFKISKFCYIVWF